MKDSSGPNKKDSSPNSDGRVEIPDIDLILEEPPLLEEPAREEKPRGKKAVRFQRGDIIPRKIWGQIKETRLRPAFNTLVPVLEQAVSIFINLVAMIMVDRYYGAAGLGEFAFFISLLAVFGYLVRFGVLPVVEHRIAEIPGQKEQTMATALAAMGATGGMALAGCFLAAFLVSGMSRISHDGIMYLILAPAIFVESINGVSCAVLDGQRRHGASSALQIRARLFSLGALFLMCEIWLPVPLLGLSFFFGHVLVIRKGKKAAGFPKLSRIMAHRKGIGDLLRAGRLFLFTDKILDAVFYLDIFILGLYVTEAQLGIYARALILARLFLIVPTGLREVVRQKCISLAQKNGHMGPVSSGKALGRFMATWASGLFFAHGVLALVALDQFPRVMNAIFHVRVWAGQAFLLFELVIPGLLFFSALTALEPVFEAVGKTAGLQKMMFRVCSANLVFNFILIPIAGLRGAAVATALTMLVHFFLFQRLLPADLSHVKLPWIGPAAAFYLSHMILVQIQFSPVMSVVVGTVLFWVMMWGVGFFNPKPAGR